MTNNLHSIFGFVGPSGSGKTTLILEMARIFPHLQVIKSSTTRQRRPNDPTEDIFYKSMLTENEFLAKIKNDEFIYSLQFSNNWYGTLKESATDVLESHCGMMAMVEESVLLARDYGINVKAIKILPENELMLPRTLERRNADLKRAAIPLDFEITIKNSFRPGGLEKSIKELSDYFTKVLIDHVAVDVR